MENKVERFLALYKEKNVTLAASKIGLSQPALSEFLEKLEARYNTKFFSRSKKGLVVTNHGRMYYEHCVEIKALQNSFERKLYKSINSTEIDKEVRIGMIDSLFQKLLDSGFRELIAKFPETKIDIQVNNTTRLVNQVKESALDFAFITKPSRRDVKELIFKNFKKEDLLLASSKPINVNNQLKLVTYNKESNTFLQIEDQLKNSGLDYKLSYFSTSPQIMLELVKLGNYSSILPRHLLESKDNQLYLSEKFNFYRQISLIHRTEYIPDAIYESICLSLQGE